MSARGGFTLQKEPNNELNFTGRSDSGPLKRVATGHAIGGSIGIFEGFDEVDYDNFAAASKPAF